MKVPVYISLSLTTDAVAGCTSIYLPDRHKKISCATICEITKHPLQGDCCHGHGNHMLCMQNSQKTEMICGPATGMLVVIKLQSVDSLDIIASASPVYST